MGLFRTKTFHGGVHPPEHKGATESKAIERLPLPPKVVIPLQQHIGAPAKPIVEKGSDVLIGQPLAEAGGFVSVPAHATISGTVTAVEEMPHPLGSRSLSVVIEGDGEERWNLFSTSSVKARELATLLVAHHSGQRTSSDRIELDEQTREQLRKLGYIE